LSSHSVSKGQGWLYAAAIVDLFSSMVVGWAMSERIDRQLCLDALTMAIEARRPSPGLVHHSDRGSQYASHDYRRALEEHEMVCSMSRKGGCWDNGVAESFWSTLKAELVEGTDFPSPASARTAVFGFIEVFYIRQRLHSTLDYRTPSEFESGDNPKAKAASADCPRNRINPTSHH
jgi:transposase InsO family protein